MKPLKAPRPKPGDPITAKWANDLADFIERIQIIVGAGVGGIDCIQTPSGTAISVSFPSPGKCVQVGGSGITAFNATTKVYGTGTCRIWNADSQSGKLVDSGKDITVGNSTLDAVGANKWGQIKYIDGIAFIDVASCT